MAPPGRRVLGEQGAVHEAALLGPDKAGKQPQKATPPRRHSEAFLRVSEDTEQRLEHRVEHHA